MKKPTKKELEERNEVLVEHARRLEDEVSSYKNAWKDELNRSSSLREQISLLDQRSSDMKFAIVALAFIGLIPGLLIIVKLFFK